MRDPLEYRELPHLLRYRHEGGHPGRLPIEEARDTLASLRNRLRILSLTSDATGYDDDDVRAFGKGYARPRMWETYGRDHTGVCLAFDAAAMTDDEGGFRRNLRTKGAANLRPVEYTEGGSSAIQPVFFPTFLMTPAPPREWSDISWLTMRLFGSSSSLIGRRSTSIGSSTFHRREKTDRLTSSSARPSRRSFSGTV